jgi:hypothetical protein
VKVYDNMGRVNARHGDGDANDERKSFADRRATEIVQRLPPATALPGTVERTDSVVLFVD